MAARAAPGRPSVGSRNALLHTRCVTSLRHVVGEYLSGRKEATRLVGAIYMILKSDGADLKAMVKLFDEGKLKVCVDEHFGFDEVKEALSKSLTARSGGKLVIDVASPAPSETCCVVA